MLSPPSLIVIVNLGNLKIVFLIIIIRQFINAINEWLKYDGPLLEKSKGS